MLSCPVCSESAPSPLSTITEMPLIGCQFAESRATALGAARGTLERSLCKACGHIYNRAFEPGRVDYVYRYENAVDLPAIVRTPMRRLTVWFAVMRWSINPSSRLAVVPVNFSRSSAPREATTESVMIQRRVA